MVETLVWSEGQVVNSHLIDPLVRGNTSVIPTSNDGMVLITLVTENLTYLILHFVAIFRSSPLDWSLCIYIVTNALQSLPGVMLPCLEECGDVLLQ